MSFVGAIRQLQPETMQEFSLRCGKVLVTRTFRVLGMGCMCTKLSSLKSPVELERSCRDRLLATAPLPVIASYGDRPRQRATLVDLNLKSLFLVLATDEASSQFTKLSSIIIVNFVNMLIFFL